MSLTLSFDRTHLTKTFKLQCNIISNIYYRCDNLKYLFHARNQYTYITRVQIKCMNKNELPTCKLLVTLTNATNFTIFITHC